MRLETRLVLAVVLGTAFLVVLGAAYRHCFRYVDGEGYWRGVRNGLVREVKLEGDVVYFELPVEAGAASWPPDGPVVTHGTRRPHEWTTLDAIQRAAKGRDVRGAPGGTDVRRGRALEGDGGAFGGGVARVPRGGNKGRRGGTGS